MCVHVPGTCLVPLEARRESWNLRTVVPVSYRVGAGSQTRVLCRMNQCSNQPRSPLLSRASPVPAAVWISG